MTDELLRALRDLNPVVDPDRLVHSGEVDWPADPALRAVLEQVRDTNHRPGPIGSGIPRHAENEETRMRTLSPDRKDMDQPSDERQPSRRSLLAVAIAAVFVAAVGLVVIANLPSEDPLQPVPPVSESDPEPEADADSATDPAGDEAVAVAEAYIDAFNAYDLDRAREVLDEELFLTSEPPDGHRDLTTIEMAFENYEVYGFNYSEVECVPNGETPGLVRCEIEWTTELHHIGGHEPSPTALNVLVVDGRIRSIDREFLPTQVWWSDFTDFLTAEHLQFVSVLEQGLDFRPSGFRQAMDELPEYFELYGQWLEDREG